MSRSFISIKNRGAQIQEEPLSADEHHATRPRDFSGAVWKRNRMISFWLDLCLVTIVALAFILPPLLERNRRATSKRSGKRTLPFIGVSCAS